MFSDPTTATLAGASKTLPRVYEEGNGTRYSTAGGDLILEIAHTASKARKRSVIRLTQNVIATDPFVAGASRPMSSTVYLVLDKPLAGFDHDKQVALIAALCGFLTAGTNAAAAKFAGGEA